MWQSFGPNHDHEASYAGRCVARFSLHVADARRNQARSFPRLYPTATLVETLDLRLDRLHCVDVSSILRRGNSHPIMSITVNRHMFLAEATTVASVLPCRRSFDPKLRPGYVLALSGRCAR
jgi:hypothetical protein